MSMPVVYIAGPFRGKSAWEVEQNVRRAEELALRVWRAGAAALCPHTNTRFFDRAAPDEVRLEGALELMRRCDAVLLTRPDAMEVSVGTHAEVDEADRLGIKTMFTFERFERWLAEWKAAHA